MFQPLPTHFPNKITPYFQNNTIEKCFKNYPNHTVHKVNTIYYKSSLSWSRFVSSFHTFKDQVILVLHSSMCATQVHLNTKSATQRTLTNTSVVSIQVQSRTVLRNAVSMGCTETTSINRPLKLWKVHIK